MRCAKEPTYFSPANCAFTIISARGRRNWPWRCLDTTPRNDSASRSWPRPYNGNGRRSKFGRVEKNATPWLGFESLDIMCRARAAHCHGTAKPPSEPIPREVPQVGAPPPPRGVRCPVFRVALVRRGAWHFRLLGPCSSTDDSLREGSAATRRF